MAQGKLKVKAKLPANVKQKKPSNKGPSKSKHCPIAPKKKKFEEAHKIKMISKTVNEKMEKEMRSRSGENKKTFSKIDEAVVAYNKKQGTSK